MSEPDDHDDPAEVDDYVNQDVRDGYDDAYAGPNGDYTQEVAKFEPSADSDYWRAGSGNLLRLADMTPLHLARALAVTINKDGIVHPRTKALLAELSKRVNHDWEKVHEHPRR